MSKPRSTHKIYEFNYSAEPNPETFDPFLKMFEQGQTMVNNARAMTNHATSYRGVLVGAAALAQNASENKLRIYVGHNDTPYKGAPKYCAEMRAIGRAIRDGYTRRIAVFTAGPTDPKVIESIIGAPARILPPCEPCNDLLEDSTLVLSAGSEEDMFGVQTGQILERLHPTMNPLKKRQKAKCIHPFTEQPLYDLSMLNWRHAEEDYIDRTSALKPEDFDQFSALRLERASAAILSLTANLAAA